MSRREQILKDDAERLKAKQKRQRRRRRVTYRRPWGSWPKSKPEPETRPDLQRAELRRLDLMDVSLTLQCAYLDSMAPTAGE